MIAAVALTNLVLGVAYCGYGVMTAVEMRRDWRTMGFSHFGAAWILMAFTCGPHHLIQGIHILFEGRRGGELDLFAVVVGLPVGVIWLALRVEAFAGGRGDRFIAGDPWYIKRAPIAAAAYLVALDVASFNVMRNSLHGPHLHPTIVANIGLVVLYNAIGWFILRTQLQNRPVMGGWSLSGVCLSAVFPTCALMHAVFAVYSATGRYGYDVHGFVNDWMSIPAAMYFLWVVRGLYHDSLRDWNGVVPDVEPVLIEVG